MMEHDVDHAAVPSSVRPDRQRATHFKGMHVLESDEPLLATLEPKEQAVLRTSGSYEERARELNVPVGTLRSRLHRARAKLVGCVATGSRSRTDPLIERESVRCDLPDVCLPVTAAPVVTTTAKQQNEKNDYQNCGHHRCPLTKSPCCSFE
jgi:hypothetical protein